MSSHIPASHEVFIYDMTKRALANMDKLPAEHQWAVAELRELLTSKEDNDGS